MAAHTGTRAAPPPDTGPPPRHPPEAVPFASGLRLIGADDAAAQLGVNRTTLNRWARRGQISYVRVGNQRRYDPAALRPPPPPQVPHRPDRRDEKLWSTGDVAARLGIDRATVRRLARAGTIPVRAATGSRLRFSRGDIERLAHSLQVDPADAVSASQAAVALGISVRTLKRRATARLVVLHRDLTGSAVMHRDELCRLLEQQPAAPAPLDPDNLTTHDVAVLLGRSDEWVRQQAVTQQIPCRRGAGGKRRFRLDDLPMEQPGAPVSMADVRPISTRVTGSGGAGR